MHCTEKEAFNLGSTFQMVLDVTEIVLVTVHTFVGGCITFFTDFDNITSP